MSNVHQINGFRSSDWTSQPLRLDKATNTLQTIDYAHHEIHGGSHFCMYINKNIPNGWTYNVAFTTPNTTSWIHMLFNVGVELEAEIILYEWVTSFTWWTAVTPINNNRNSATASGITDMEFDTTVTLWTPVILATAVEGSWKNFWWGSRNDQEFILKQNTKYYMLVTNQATWASNETNIWLCRYEHTNIA